MRGWMLCGACVCVALMGAVAPVDAAKNEQSQEARALAFVEAFNSGDTATYEAYMQANRTRSVLEGATPAQRRESYASLREQFGDIEAEQVMLVSPQETVLIVMTQDGRVRMTFRHEGDDSRISSIQFEPAAADVDIPDDWSGLSELLEHFTPESGAPSWAIAVVKGGKVVEQAAFGVRELGKDEPVSPETSLYHWGSIGKSVTGTMIGALVERGLLDWDTTIGDVFKNAGILAAYRNVTIAQLMGHRAGVPSYDNFTREGVDAMRARYKGSMTEQRAQWVVEVLGEAPLFEPGEGHRYSNAGVTVAGAMAERVSGKAWEELVREHVYEPLQMTSAGSGWPATAGRPNQTRGHFGPSADRLSVMPLDALEYILDLSAPAGNVHSTVGDMALYAIGHLNGMAGNDGFLRAGTVQRLHTPDIVIGEPYSFGWAQRQMPDGKTAHMHNGGAGSFYAEVRLIPDADLAIAVMTNAGMGEASAEALFGALYERYAPRQ